MFILFFEYPKRMSQQWVSRFSSSSKTFEAQIAAGSSVLVQNKQSRHALHTIRYAAHIPSFDTAHKIKKKSLDIVRLAQSLFGPDSLTLHPPHRKIKNFILVRNEIV